MPKGHKANLLDFYKPEWFIDFARGYYARVFSARDRNHDQDVALKVLLSKHINRSNIGREYQAFGLEARLLHHFAKHKAVVNLLDCGFISNCNDELPRDGEVFSFGNDVEEFDAHLTEFHQRGWRPYLCETLMPERHNLFMVMRENIKDKRRRLPTEEGLALSMQYADLLQEAHADDIVYLDAKLEHIYWGGEQLCIIDWNSSRMLRDANNQDEDPDYYKQNDIHSFVTGVMYPIFTGMPPQGERHREQPSCSDAVDERYRHIHDLDFGMEPTLSRSLIELMRAAAGGEYHTIQQFKNGLESCARQNGWQIGNGSPSVSAARARDDIREGVIALRHAQQEIEQARQRFMVAIENTDTHVGKEAERLIALINEFWNHRVIP